MQNQLRKRMFQKRIVRGITFSIVKGLSIELNTYALIRPTVPGISHHLLVEFRVFATSHLSYLLCVVNYLLTWFVFIGTITWLDSITNLPLKVPLLVTLYFHILKLFIWKWEYYGCGFSSSHIWLLSGFWDLLSKVHSHFNIVTGPWSFAKVLKVWVGLWEVLDSSPYVDQRRKKVIPIYKPINQPL